MSMNMNDLQQRFEKQYGRLPAGIVRAPGRVNLIGEHTDYNDGFVLPIAINRSTLAAWAPGEGSTIRMASAQSDRPAVVDLSNVSKGEPAWANYPRGVIAGLLAAGAADGGTAGAAATGPSLTSVPHRRSARGPCPTPTRP